MTHTRHVRDVINARPMKEGVGADVYRAVGSYHLPNIDPILLMDEFLVSKPAGFPNHPHRGFETITYMLDGAFEHTDFRGHAGLIKKGDLQWMTAGRGIIHSEFPHTPEVNQGIQLWINLAARDKMTEPRYQEFKNCDLPTLVTERAKVTVLAGEVLGAKSPVATLTPVLFWDIELQADAQFSASVPAHFNIVIYVLSGRMTIGEENKPVRPRQMAILNDGDALLVRAIGVNSRCLVVGGQPLNEPIARGGPFVMNTQEEIRQAMEDYTNSTNGFEKHEPKATATGPGSSATND